MYLLGACPCHGSYVSIWWFWWWRVGGVARAPRIRCGTEPPKWPDVRNRWCIRHMGANFYDHFKNKDLMDLFKRLCAENQQRKFNALWQLLDELTLKQLEERGGGASTSNTREGRWSSGSAIKPFSQWIRVVPKEKWALLYDTDGSHYGIMMTNQAECYNMVIRLVRGLPLVAIV